MVLVLERLDVAAIIDRAVPMRGRAHLTHGEVITVLIAIRLTDQPVAGHAEVAVKR